MRKINSVFPRDSAVDKGLVLPILSAVPSTIRSSGAASAQEVERKTEEDDDDKLHSWPPKASLSKTGGSSSSSTGTGTEHTLQWEGRLLTNKLSSR